MAEGRSVAELVAELRELATIWDPAIHHSELLTDAADSLTRPAPEPVGAFEIAERMGVQPKTVAMWKYRTEQGTLPVPFPPARWKVSDEDAYDWWLDIVPWAQASDRASQAPEATGPRRVSPEASARALDLRQRTG